MGPEQVANFTCEVPNLPKGISIMTALLVRSPDEHNFDASFKFKPPVEIFINRHLIIINNDKNKTNFEYKSNVFFTNKNLDEIVYGIYICNGDYKKMDGTLNFYNNVNAKVDNNVKLKIYIKNKAKKNFVLIPIINYVQKEIIFNNCLTNKYLISTNDSGYGELDIEIPSYSKKTVEEFFIIGIPVPDKYHSMDNIEPVIISNRVSLIIN